MSFTESIIEQATIEWLKDLGYSYASGPEIAFDSSNCERANLFDTLLPKSMRGEIGVSTR